MAFRDRLIATLRLAQPVLDVPEVMIGGSQVPNLLEPEAASTLVVSQDVDIVVPVGRHAEVVQALARVRGLAPAPDEPSVWVPTGDPVPLEVNFIGLDPDISDTAESYVFEHDRLPLLVFGLLSLLREGRELVVGDVHARLPRPAGLLVEKLLTERAGLKGQRDLLVALGLLLVAEEADLEEVVRIASSLPAAQRGALQSALVVLSLAQPLDGMPDPAGARDRVARLLDRLEPRR
jgi:hypothetical protein